LTFLSTYMLIVYKLTLSACVWRWSCNALRGSRWCCKWCWWGIASERELTGKSFYWSFIIIIFMKFVNSVLLICEFGYCIGVS